MVLNRTHSTARRTTAYTLIELLVVIAIIGALAALSYTMWSSFSASTQVTRNADQVQAGLLITKQIARRDRTPTGVRLIPSTANPNFVRELVYIHQPEPFMPPVGGTLQSYAGGVAVFSANVDFWGGLPAANTNDHPVQVGDYLEVNGGGLPLLITAINPPSGGVGWQVSVSGTFTATPPTTNFRVIRQPRLSTGEEPIVLRGDCVIDLSMSLNVPRRMVGTQEYREIVFSPGGGVIGKGTSGGDKVILWMRDTSKPNVTDGEPILVAIQINTGFIGSYAVAPTGGDYYINTRDPHSSGF